MKDFKLKLFWHIARLLRWLFERTLIDCSVEYDKCNRVVVVHTQLTKKFYRTAVLNKSDKTLDGIKSLMYAFNLKPYKL